MRIGGIPAVLATATPNKVIFRLADVVDYGSIGINRANLPTFVPGRAIMASGGLAVQIARPRPDLETLVDRRASAASAHGGPEPLGTLSESIPLDEVVGLSTVGPERWDLAIARRDRDLRAAALTLYDGEQRPDRRQGSFGRARRCSRLPGRSWRPGPVRRSLRSPTRRSPLVGHQLVQGELDQR